jgi:hypothetical protein
MNRLTVVCGAALLASASVHADAVSDWNQLAADAVGAARVSPDMQARNMAVVHLAIFEALNSIEPRYQPYRAKLPVEAGALPDAAVAAAAHDALVRLLPEQAKQADQALEAALAKMPDSPGRASGLRLGQRAAQAVLAERVNDGSDAPITYRPFTLPGKYVPTQLPASSTWHAVKPFVLKSGDQFRPPAPYALNSAAWARDYNEVKRMGAKTGSDRTPEQNDVARFWQLTGTATHNPVTRQVAAAKGLDSLDTARLFALSTMACADAAIALFDAKYAHGFWRPVTAIRNGDIDGNDATTLDPRWEPMAVTPMHPEYPCAHCTFQGAAAGVLQTVYGDSVPRFTLTSSAAPDVKRSFDKLSDYVADVINGRVWEGVHYRTSGEVGAALGRRVAEHVVATQLKPLN